MTETNVNLQTAPLSPNSDKALLQLTGLQKIYDQTEVLKDIKIGRAHV